MGQFDRPVRARQAAVVARTSRPQHPVSAASHALLALQRTAGNRATVDLLARRRPSVQRILTTTTGDLDKYISASDRLLGVGFRQSNDQDPFAAIRSTLYQYQKDIKTYRKEPKVSLDTQKFHLETLDSFCQSYLEQKRKAKESKQEEDRRRIVEKLHEEILFERSAFSKREGEKRYQDNIVQSNQPVGEEETDPAKKFGFKALSGDGKLLATNHEYGERRDRGARIKEEMEKYGLTDAEVSGISIFSGGDFKYMNPVTANSSSWIESNREKNQDERFAGVDDKTLREEGSLHTAMALKGLNKMPRYKGESYRGARYTPDEFKASFAVGQKSEYKTLSSSSFDMNIALDFLHGVGTGTKPRQEATVGVLSILTDSGVDISNIAMARSEAEVLILPGSWFELKSLEEVDGNSKYAKWVKQAEGNQPLPTRWYIARYSATEAQSTAKRPRRTEPWKANTPKGLNMPITASNEEFMRAREGAGKMLSSGMIGARSAKGDGELDEGGF